MEPIIDPLSPNPYAKNANDFKSVIYKPGEFVFCAVSDFNGKLFMEFGKIDGVIFNPNTENDPVYIVRFIDNTWARIEDPSFIAKAGSA